MGTFIREQRLGQNLTFGDLARRLHVGTNHNKTCRALQALEGGSYSNQLLRKVTAALGLGAEHIVAVNNLIEQEKREHETWLDEPIERRLYIRAVPGVGVSTAVPGDLTREEAVAWAQQRAKQWHMYVFLRWSRREGFWIDPEGKVYSVDSAAAVAPQAPGLQIGNGTVTFDVNEQDKS